MYVFTVRVFFRQERSLGRIRIRMGMGETGVPFREKSSEMEREIDASVDA